MKTGPQHISWFVYAMSFDMFSVSVFIYVPVLVFKSRRQTNGMYSLIIFLNAIQIVDLKYSWQACVLVILAAIFYKYCLNNMQF